MAALIPTNAKVVLDGASILSAPAGVTIARGEAVYLSSGKLALAKNDDVNAAVALGIAINDGDLDDIIYYVVVGDLDLGVTLVKGEIYHVGGVGGEIVPEADVVTGDYVTILGVAKDTAILSVNINVTGILL